MDDHKQSCFTFAEDKSDTVARATEISDVKFEDKGYKQIKHWSQTESGATLARVSSHMHKMMISSPSEGGMRDFFDDHCLKFETTNEEYDLIHHQLYKDFETKVSETLDTFCKIESCDPVEIMQRCKRAAEEHKQASKHLAILLASTSFAKFVRLMRAKAAQKKSAEAKVATDHNK